MLPSEADCPVAIPGCITPPPSTFRNRLSKYASAEQMPKFSFWADVLACIVSIRTSQLCTRALVGLPLGWFWMAVNIYVALQSFRPLPPPGALVATFAYLC